MLLTVSNSRDETTNYLLSKVRGAGLSYVRLDSDTLHDRAAITFDAGSPVLLIDGHRFLPQQFSHVWLRRPERLTVCVGADEAEQEHSRREWSAAIEGFLAQIPVQRWINHPTANTAASHKLDQLARATALGLVVPASLVTQDAVAAKAFASAYQNRIVAKPLASGYVARPGGRDSLIYTSAVSVSDLESLGPQWGCPALLQQRIDKATDIRVTVLDNKMMAYAIDRTLDGEQALDVRTDNMSGAKYRRLPVPAVEGARLSELLRAYRLRFAAVDFAIDRHGRWVFFEINPNGQWAWLDLVGGAEIWRLFVETFKRPPDSEIEPLAPADGVTWLALRACGINATRHQVLTRRYDHQQYVPQIGPGDGRATKELLDYAIATYERANDRRKAVDEKAKLLGGFVTFAITVCAATASRVSFPVVMMPALVLFVVSLLLLLSYFRLSIVAQPSVTADEAKKETDELVKQLISDYLSSADHNERSTSFCADIFRAAVIAFIAGIVALTLAVPVSAVL